MVPPTSPSVASSLRDHFSRFRLLGVMPEQPDAEAGRTVGDEKRCSQHVPGGLVGILCGCCCGSIAVVLIALLIASFKGLRETKYGLVRNSVTGWVDLEHVYHGGRNFIGFWNNYVAFPATLQSLEWLEGAPLSPSSSRDLAPFTVRTADGLVAWLGVAAQYLVVRDRVPDIYRMYKADYEHVFQSGLLADLQDLFATVHASEFHTQRHRIISDMLTRCHRVCNSTMQGALRCWGIDLLDVAFEPAAEQATIKQQVEQQWLTTQTTQLEASALRSQSQLTLADLDRQVQLAAVTANTTATGLVAQAHADSDFEWQRARARVLSIIQNTIKAGSQSMSHAELLTYLEKVALIDSPARNLVYGDFSHASVEL